MFDEESPVLTKIKELLKWPFIFWSSLALAGLVAISLGLYFIIIFSNERCLVEESKKTFEVAPAAIQDAIQDSIFVDLAGAVANPGLYELAAGSRLATVIDQAGGFTPQTDSIYISQELNLAQQLNDGDKIYIFSQAERQYQQTAAEFCQSLTTTKTTKAASSQAGVDATGQISINSASTDELQTLEGIGEKRAEEIVAGRPYQSLQQLVDQAVLTTTVFEKIKTQLKL